MKRFIKMFASCFFALMLALPGGASAQNAVQALIVYDRTSGTPYDKLGHAYAIMLKNLLGHFDGTVTEIPVQDYTPGMAENYSTIFYMGALYDTPLPESFLQDVSTTEKTVVWFHYNIWQLAWNPALNFSANFGLNFTGLQGMNAAPTSANPSPGFFDTVQYKNKNFVKYYAYNSAANIINADPDVGAMQILDPTKATSVATINNPKANTSLPYVIRSKNFWYFADMPFSYIGPRDRYLVLTDLLHDIVGIDHPESHQALVRLEDVDAMVTFANIKSLTDYLKSSNIPFSIATIPHYRDPLGYWTNGVSRTVPMSQATDLKRALNYALARGAEIVQHGWTHQYENRKNANSGVSGDDYEFWDASNNTPLPDDSPLYTTNRILAGKLELTSHGYNPVAWEPPHYQASATSMRTVPRLYAKTYQRAVYYTSDTPDFNAPVGKDFAVGQFYPYVIKRDYYGQMIIPENLGNIEYDNSPGVDLPGEVVYTWQDIYLNAQYALTVRDGFASFFFHPYLLDPDMAVPALADFKELVSRITALGYTWTKPSAVD